MKNSKNRDETRSSSSKPHNKTEKKTEFQPANQETDARLGCHPAQGPAGGSPHRHPPVRTPREPPVPVRCPPLPRPGPSSLETPAAHTHQRRSGPGPRPPPPPLPGRTLPPAGFRLSRGRGAARPPRGTGSGPAATGPAVGGAARGCPLKRRAGRPHLGLKSWNKPRRFIAARPSAPLYQARMARPPPPEPGLASPPLRPRRNRAARPAPPRPAHAPGPHGDIPLPGNGRPSLPGVRAALCACARRRLARAP